MENYKNKNKIINSILRDYKDILNIFTIFLKKNLNGI